MVRMNKGSDSVVHVLCVVKVQVYRIVGTSSVNIKSLFKCMYYKSDSLCHVCCITVSGTKCVC